MSIGRWYRGWSVKGKYKDANKDADYSYLSGPCRIIRPYRIVLKRKDGRKYLEKIVNVNYRM